VNSYLARKGSLFCGGLVVEIEVLLKLWGMGLETTTNASNMGQEVNDHRHLGSVSDCFMNETSK